MEAFSFEKFARLEFFREVNAKFLDFVNLREGQKIVDLACGTGTITEIILRKIKNTRDALIFAVDTSQEALNHARKNLQRFKRNAIKFINARAEELRKILNSKVDAVIFCNAIHYVSEKEKLIRDIYNILKDRGYFAFNTSFFKEAHLPETDLFYKRWMMRAIRILIKKYNIRPPKEEKTEARRKLSAEEYRKLLEKCRFKIKEFHIRRVNMPLEGWLAISEFRDFITGIFPGVPLDKASFALKEGVKEIYESMKLRAVPRNWLEVVAVK